MKLKSQEPIRGKSLECTAPFDKDFIEDIEQLAEEKILLVNYDAAFLQINIPIHIQSAYFSVQAEGDNLLIELTVYADDKNDKVSPDYFGKWGYITFDVEFESNEGEKFMSFLLAKLLQRNNIS